MCCAKSGDSSPNSLSKLQVFLPSTFQGVTAEVIYWNRHWWWQTSVTLTVAETEDTDCVWNPTPTEIQDTDSETEIGHTDSDWNLQHWQWLKSDIYWKVTATMPEIFDTDSTWTPTANDTYNTGQSLRHWLKSTTLALTDIYIVMTACGCPKEIHAQTVPQFAPYPHPTQPQSPPTDLKRPLLPCAQWSGISWGTGHKSRTDPARKSIYSMVQVITNKHQSVIRQTNEERKKKKKNFYICVYSFVAILPAWNHETISKRGRQVFQKKKKGKKKEIVHEKTKTKKRPQHLLAKFSKFQSTQTRVAHDR